MLATARGEFIIPSFLDSKSVIEAVRFFLARLAHTLPTFTQVVQSNTPPPSSLPLPSPQTITLPPTMEDPRGGEGAGRKDRSQEEALRQQEQQAGAHPGDADDNPLS